MASKIDWGPIDIPALRRLDGAVVCSVSLIRELIDEWPMSDSEGELPTVLQTVLQTVLDSAQDEMWAGMTMGYVLINIVPDAEG